MMEKDLLEPETSEAGPKRRPWSGEKIGALWGAILGASFFAVTLVLSAFFKNEGIGLAAILAIALGYGLLGAFIGGVAGKFISGFRKDVLGYDASMAGSTRPRLTGQLTTVVSGYRCPRCNSTHIGPYGNPSPLDGKRGLQCQACQLKMAPARSRSVLWILLLIAVVAACGTLGAFFFLLEVGIASVFCLAGFFFCLICILVGIIELRKPVPIQGNHSPNHHETRAPGKGVD
jgi:hypothetical protein